MQYIEFTQHFVQKLARKLDKELCYPIGLRRIYELAVLAQEHAGRGHRSEFEEMLKGNEDARCALGAVSREISARQKFLKGTIEGLRLLNVAEESLEDYDPEGIGELNATWRYYALVNAANILAFYAALDEDIYPLAPKQRDQQ